MNNRQKPFDQNEMKRTVIFYLNFEAQYLRNGLSDLDNFSSKNI